MQFNEILKMHKSSANIKCPNWYNIKQITPVSDRINIQNNSGLKEGPDNTLNAEKKKNKVFWGLLLAVQCKHWTAEYFLQKM